MNKLQSIEEYSALFELHNNTINIFGEINTQMASLIISQIQYLDYKFKANNIPKEERIITIQINSVGGSVSDGLAIYDAMNGVESIISTVAMGRAASMGALLLSAGTRGYRKATKNCEILIHQPLGGASGQASDIMIAANHIERTKKLLNTILSENTGKSIKEIKKDTDRDYIMNAEEALKYGLIDYIIPSNNKAKKEEK